MKLRSDGAGRTRAIAATVAESLDAGDVVLVAGELGAGKTTFVQGLAAGLGVAEPVTSPTYTIVQEYRGRLPLVHVDVYRLDRMQEFDDLGIDELGAARGVTVIEWGDVVARVLPRDHLLVRIEPGDAPDERFIVFEPAGSWRSRAAALQRALEDER